MSLNVNAQEFIPSFGSKSTNDATKTTKKAKSSNSNHLQNYQNYENNNYNPSANQYSIPIQQIQQNGGYRQYPSYPQQQYPPQTLQFNVVNCNNYNPYINNNNNNNIQNHCNNHNNNKPKQLQSAQQTEKILKQQKEKQQKVMIMQRKDAAKQLLSLFPSISTSKLETILKTQNYNLKKSILFVLQSKEFKGEYDKHICVYHLSKSCQFENNPSKCRYNHDREVPSAICQFWLSNNCIKNDQCPFLHRIPKSRVNFNSAKQTTNESKQGKDPLFDIEELVLMLTAMFPQHKSVYLKKLLAQHAMNIKPVVATLLQGDVYSLDNNTTSVNNTESEEKKNNNTSERPVCRYFLMGECKLLDCMFSHDTAAASATCKYWLWGYCSRGDKCIYKHSLPTVNTQHLQQQKIIKQQQRQKSQQQLKTPQVKKTKVNKPKKAPSDLVAKLRLGLLKESFPNIPSNQLTAAFVAKQYDVEATKVYLMQKYKTKPIDVINNQTKKMNLNSNMNHGNNNSKQHRNNEGHTLMQKIGWVETGDSLNDLYKSKRNKAEEHARIRNQLFMRAVDAYLKGNRKLAKELSTKGREHDKEMHRLHREAGDNIYESRNKKLGLNVIDLHGLHIQEATKKLDDRIAKIKKMLKNSKRRKNKQKQNDNKTHKNNDSSSISSSSYVIDILTGTGHHSFGGRAKLAPAIISWCKKKKIKYKQMNFIDGRGGNIRLFIE